jgi:hypothetical protein
MAAFSIRTPCAFNRRCLIPFLSAWTMDNRSGKSKLDLIVKTYDLLSFQHVAEAALKNEAIKLN